MYLYIVYITNWCWYFTCSSFNAWYVIC